MMSHRRLGRVVSDLSHSNSRSVTTDHVLHHHHQSATTNNNDEGGNVGKATKQKLSLLISSVVAWTRTSESGGETGRREKNGGSRKQQQAHGGGTGGRRRRGGLEIVMAVRKYVAMVEQLLTSSFYFASSSSRPNADRRRRDGRRPPHTFTSARHVAVGNANAAHAQSSSSKRHSRGRLSSAPASLRGSPATSGHLSVRESVTKASMSMSSSEVSTMEELQSAIQAAIAHCKNSVAAAAAGENRQEAA